MATDLGADIAAGTRMLTKEASREPRAKFSDWSRRACRECPRWYGTAERPIHVRATMRDGDRQFAEQGSQQAWDWGSTSPPKSRAPMVDGSTWHRT